MRTPRASGLAGLAALASLLAFASPLEAQEGLQVSDAEVRALVLALKDKPIDRAQHDLLVALGERAATSDEALTGDLLFSGWALVAADRPLLGYPLILETLERPPLLASEALQSVVRAEKHGQDGLVRDIVALARTINPRAAERLRRSVKQPVPLERAQRKLRRQLGELDSGAWVLESSDAPGQGLVSWWVAPPAGTPRPALILLPEGASPSGLPRECQSVDRLAEAASWAAAGWLTVLPGLRGCDGSDGLYRGLDDAEHDLRTLVAQLRSLPDTASVELLGTGSGGQLALLLALRGLEVDRVVAVAPESPSTLQHLPEELRAGSSVAQQASELPASVVVFEPGPELLEALEAANRQSSIASQAPEREVLEEALKTSHVALPDPAE